MHSEKKYFSIGEVAKLKKVTIKALRYYHDIGLLVPSYINESNGYRYYSLDQFIHLDIIKSCRDAGVSIKELQELFSHADTGYLKQFIHDKSSEIQEKINQFEETKMIIQTISNKIEESQTILRTEGFAVNYFPERYLITTSVTQVGDFQELVNQYQLEAEMETRGIKPTYEHGTLYTLSKHSELEPTAVFELIDSKDFISNEFDSSFMKLPSGYYLTYTLSKETEELKLMQMCEYLQQKNLHTDFILTLDLYADIFNVEDYHCQAQAYIGKNPPSILNDSQST